MIGPQNPERLWQRYVLAVALIALAISVSHYMATQSSGLSAEIAADVNKSGRQRMLSQRITHFAFALSSASSPAHLDDLRRTLDADLDLFLSSHEALRARHYLTEGHQTLYSGSERAIGLDDMVDHFSELIAKIRSIALAQRADTTFVTGSTLSELHDLATGPLLRELNNSVQQFELAVATTEASDKRVANISFAIALGLLLFEALFIFWPAHRAIIASFSKLRKEREFAEDLQRHTQKIAEDRTEALAAKTKFFNHLSLELRTPLNGIVAGSDILKDANLCPDDRETVKVISDAGEELTRKIDLLLSASSGTSENIEAEKPIVISDELHPILSHYDKLARAKNLALEQFWDLDEKAEILSFPRLIRESFSAVLDNAVRLTQRGFIRCSVTTMPNRAQTRLMIVVEDTGPGIPKLKRDRIFEPMEMRIEQATKPTSGLGLSLFKARRDARAVGGDVTVSDRAGGGSRFTIVIPFTAVQNAAEPEFST